jgi:hypothetical protein
LKGDVDAAVKLIDELSKLKPSSVGLEEESMLTMFKEGLALAQLGSVNFRVEGVRREVANTVCDAIFDNKREREPNLLNVLTAAVVNVAMRSMNLCSAGIASAISFEFAEVASDMPIALRVLFPSLSDVVHVAIYPTPPCDAKVGKRFVMGVQSNLDFLRVQSWRINKSFLFLYVSDDVEPFDLERAFDRFSLNFATKQVWASHAAPHFASFLSPEWGRDGAKFHPPRGAGFNVLVSWDEELHRRLCAEVERHIARTGRLDTTRKLRRFTIPGVKVGRDDGKSADAAFASFLPSAFGAKAVPAPQGQSSQVAVSLADLFEDDIGGNLVGRAGKSAFNVAMGIVQEKFMELADEGSVDDMCVHFSLRC